MKLFILPLYFVLTACTGMAFPTTPNPEWAKGSLCTPNHDDYVEDRYDEQIPYCERNVSSKQKADIYALYKIPTKCKSYYTIDHIIPLSIGGDNSEDNLWPEHKKVKATRPNLENELYHAMKNGLMRQREAVKIILEEKYKSNRLPASFSTGCN